MSPILLLGPDEAVHGNDRWYQRRRQGVTASEIAIVLGISPYDSPFSLYWSKVNDWRWPGNEYADTGRHLESAIAEWWEFQQGGTVRLKPAGLYASAQRHWQLATPDRLIHMTCTGCGGTGHAEHSLVPTSTCEDCRGLGIGSPFVGVLECKWVAHSWDGWGDPGTDDIPVHYRAQGLQLLDVLDLDDCQFAALGPGGFRTYQIRRDEKDLRVMRRAGAEFMARLAAGEPPDIDSHTATIRTLKALHPSVEDRDVEVSVEFAEGYRRARALSKRAESIVDRYEARIRVELGDARRLMCGKRLVASRSVYDRKPYEVGPATIDRLNPGRAATYL